MVCAQGPGLLAGEALSLVVLAAAIVAVLLLLAGWLNWRVMRRQRLIGEQLARAQPARAEMPDGLEEPEARIKLYRARDGLGYVAEWYVDRPTPNGATASAGIATPHADPAVALADAVARLARHLSARPLVGPGW